MSSSSGERARGALTSLAHTVFVVVKPAGGAQKERIVQRLAKHGFSIVTGGWRSLSPEDARALYPEIFAALWDDTARRPGPLWRNHERYLTSSSVYLAAAAHSAEDAHARMTALKGASPRSDECAPGTLRSDFPGPSVFNAFHSAADADESEAMFAYFALR